MYYLVVVSDQIYPKIGLSMVSEISTCLSNQTVTGHNLDPHNENNMTDY